MAKLKMLLKAGTTSLNVSLYSNDTISIVDTDSSYGVSYKNNYNLNITTPPPIVDFYVTLEGDFNLLQFSGNSVLLECSLSDKHSITNMDRMFSGCKSLVSISELSGSNVVTSMNNIFFNCSSLESIPLLDVSNVTNLDGAFEYCMLLKNLKLKGLKTNVNFSTSPIDTDSILYILNNVQKVSNATIGLGEETYYKLYANDNEYINAVNKGWTTDPAISADKIRKSNYKVEYYYDGIRDDNETESYTDIVTNTIISSYNDKIKNNYLLEKTENYPLTITRIENDNIIKVYYLKIPSTNPFKVVYTDSLDKYNQIPNPDDNTMYIIGEGSNEMIIFNNQLISNKGATVVRL